MKILFLIGATSRIRNFSRALVQLADDGHTIELAGRLRKGAFELPDFLAHPRISGRVNPTQRSDGWRDVVDLLRGARDYVRYFDPRYGQATRLVRRAYEIAPTEFALFCERHSWVKRRWAQVAKALELCEALIPSDPAFEAFLAESKPDVVLVTPLVTFESYQTDYVKAAHRLGIPVAFIPFSWDNLTNKGLMRVLPDRVLVWNDLQRTEAVDLHGCPPERIVVTGAARFDDFFERTPSMGRAEFLSGVGLDPAKPMVLFLGSSQLTGPNEMELVRRWVESMRASSDDVVRTCNILIRPHPALRTSWTSVDYSDVPGVALSLDASRGADQELFDSIHHAHATVGLNTSAMLEAAIGGRPVHTLVVPGFDEGQVGTMHFHYLVEAYGGLATVARDFDEHCRQMSDVLRAPEPRSQRSCDFAAAFLRPRGAEHPVSPVLAHETLRAAAIVKPPAAAGPWWHAPARWALLSWLRRQRRQSRTVADTTIVGTSPSLRPVKTALEEIQEAATPIVVGPWVDSLGNELLYWIPFVRWVAATYGLAPERLLTVSHGGPRDLYGTLGHRHIDVGSLFSSSELEHWAHRTVPQSEQDSKQAVMPPFDREIVERAVRAFELTEHQVLHPSMWFRVMRRASQDRALERLGEVLQHTRLAPASFTGGAAMELPRRFVAVSVAPTPALPNNGENQAFASELLSRLVAEHDVVLLDVLVPPGVTVPTSDRVHRLPGGLSQPDLTHLQARVAARALAFVGSHGDLAVLAAACGIPATTYHSERLPADQVDRLHAAAASAEWGAVRVERARRFKGVRLPVKASV